MPPSFPSLWYGCSWGFYFEQGVYDGPQYQKNPAPHSEHLPVFAGTAAALAPAPVVWIQRFLWHNFQVHQTKIGISSKSNLVRFRNSVQKVKPRYRLITRRVLYLYCLFLLIVVIVVAQPTYNCHISFFKTLLNQKLLSDVLFDRDAQS